MLFNSFLFWVFFIVVLFLYRSLSSNYKLQNRLLLVASYIFYGTWDWRFLFLILLSTLVDYFVAKNLTKQHVVRKRAWLSLSIITNLGLLGFFKYFGFFAGELHTLFASLGMQVSIPTLNIVLPVGISFYTFQTMSYTIDVYRGITKPIMDFLDFALYVAFFPQLVAGPIERSAHLMPQIINARIHKSSDFADGLYLVLLGMFKKVVIADNMALIANGIFNSDTSNLTGFECLVGVYAFAFQIYGDFSGYSAIARGVSRWLGFDLMVNFRMPYFAISPKDFWNRWHISLSTWLRDYLYIPLGGNRNGNVHMYRNLMLTMLLGGLWHGAGWTFIAWGAFHGIILIIFRLLSRHWNVDHAEDRPFSINLIMGLITFHLVCITWLLFRADSIQHATVMFLKIFTEFQITDLGVSGIMLIMFYVTPLILFEYWLERGKNLWRLVETGWVWRTAAYAYCLVMLIFFQPGVHSEFIYFQF